MAWHCMAGNIFSAFQPSPHTNICVSPIETDNPQSQVWNTVYEDGLYPQHMKTYSSFYQIMPGMCNFAYGLKNSHSL
jgi:hypothetical protein